MQWYVNEAKVKARLREPRFLAPPRARVHSNKSEKFLAGLNKYGIRSADSFFDSVVGMCESRV